MVTANVYPKGVKYVLSDHFVSTDFDCKCSVCTTTIIHPLLIERLETLRGLLLRPILITSGYRCKDYQADLASRGYDTAKGTSTHELGEAADIKAGTLFGTDLTIQAENAGFTSIGTGFKWVHVDLRPGKRRWSYKY